MSFSVGSLVKARGREWVVLPDSREPVLVLRPLGGSDEEIAGIHTRLESVEPATVAAPTLRNLGDHRSCRLLRDAVRLGFRSSAGPFRSLGRIGCEPRPYQLVPLLMALKLDPVRLLIADDVGIGKTIEALLIARELLDRGEATRLAVLCPPHLAEQWQREMRQKFDLDGELVLPGTAARLERGLPAGSSLFDIYPIVIVSTDYIKSDRRRDDFLRACPELVIVDEAHGCAWAEAMHRGRHQRHHLLKRLAQDEGRHLILVTATPHSGKEEAFRSLLVLLDQSFAELPADLSGPENEPHRRHLAAHFVQRRRGDIEHFLGSNTPFPDREDAEATYRLSSEYKKLFDRVLSYARERVLDEETGSRRQRVRWWSMLALLRSLASSPAAAAATLRNRAGPAEAETADEADELGRRTVLDLIEEEAAEGVDAVPGSDTGWEGEEEDRHRRRLLDMARAAEKLAGEGDAKLLRLTELVQGLLQDGFRPIVFCRFIPTAEYVAEQLRARLGSALEVSAVTGRLPHEDREERVLDLVRHSKRVLVCTDCLAEGINLQEHFDAVLHYDLSWNPTRHEQREGRVDRYGQTRRQVRVLTYYGIDNQIDGVVLDVLLRKHRTIRNSLGISVPVPFDTEQVIEAVFEGLLLREDSGAAEQLVLLDDYFKPEKERLHAEWEASAEREKRSRTMFAQHAIRPEEVAPELEAARRAIGSPKDVARFVQAALGAHGAMVTDGDPVEIDLRECPGALRDVLNVGDRMRARFDLPVEEGVLHLHRTHPFVEALAGYVQDTALDPREGSPAARAGVIRTDAVASRTTLLLLRYRFHIVAQRGDKECPMLAEDWALAAFRGTPDAPEWLSPEEAESLLAALPTANVPPDQSRHHLGRSLEALEALQAELVRLAEEQGQKILEAHRRVRKAAKARGVRHGIESQFPDVLGLYLLVPAN